MYKCKYFKIEELVSRSIFEKYGDIAWQFFDPLALRTLDQIREQFGQLLVNNWHSGGTLQYRGYREKACTVGAVNSQHRHGRAFDCSSKMFSAEDMRAVILTHQHKFPLLAVIEMDVSWLHFDVRNINTDSGIVKIHP